jgi:deoxyribodipyrimidine photo-lyase
MKEKIVIYWSRRDFRLLDNPALAKATQFSKDNNLIFLPIFIFDKQITNSTLFQVGLPRLKYLDKALSSFKLNFNDFRIFDENYQQVFNTLSTAFNVSLFFNEDVEPYSIKRDGEVKEIIEKNGGSINSFSDQLTINPNTRSGSGNLYSVYTPFSKSVKEDFINARYFEAVKVEAIKSLKQIHDLEKLGLKEIQINNSHQLFDNYSKWEMVFETRVIDLKELNGEPNIDSWYFNEIQALDNFQEFLANKVKTYKVDRDNLGIDGVSKMSVALKWGLVSPRTLVNKVIENAGTLDLSNLPGHNHYISEILWREFYKYITINNQNIFVEEFQPKYRKTINWEKGERAYNLFLAWIKGQTGYSLVDAAMNQIKNEFWMHNRTRMVTASILTKNFGIDWRFGENYFRQLLIDLDESSNNGGWQWAASVGADPKPIRIFNPYLQADNYDKDFVYRRKWLPKDYNIKEPIIDHSKARDEALKRYRLDKSVI